MTRVLEFNINGGGTLSIVMNIILNSESYIKFDIAALGPFENVEVQNLLEKKGVGIFFLGNSGNVIIKRISRSRNLIRLLKENKYDCIHLHSDVSNVLLLYGIISRVFGVKKIIMHSHSTSLSGNRAKLKMLLHKLCRPFLKYIASNYLACSSQAAKWMFPNINPSKITILNNGIDLHKFGINNEVREQIRKELGFSEINKVIGHVGRFSVEKNHIFIIDLFSELVKESNAYKLLLVGDGNLKPKIEEYAKKKDVFENIFFTGIVSNVQNYMQAMDLFILPSMFEGLGLVAIEAQACGLPVILSTGVPTQAKLTENVRFISTDNMSNWKKSVKEMIELPKNDNVKFIKSGGYDIKQTVEEIKNIYLS